MKTILLWSILALLFQVAFALLMYEVEYADIISVRQYQSLQDQTHNKNTLALERCMAKAVLNHSDNWDRMCKAYGLEQGCGLPQEGYNRLAGGLNKDNDTCKANHQYAVPTTIGPRAFQNEEGNPI